MLTFIKAIPTSSSNQVYCYNILITISTNIILGNQVNMINGQTLVEDLQCH